MRETFVRDQPKNEAKTTTPFSHVMETERKNGHVIPGSLTPDAAPCGAVLKCGTARHRNATQHAASVVSAITDAAAALEWDGVGWVAMATQCISTEAFTH